MAFVSVAAQMAVQAAIQAAMGKSKEEIGRSAAKTAISGAIGGAVGGAMGSSSTGGAMASEGIGGALGGMAANAAFGEDIGAGALSGGISGAARGYVKGPDIGSKALIDPNMSGRDWFPQGANTGDAAMSNFTESLPMNPFSSTSDYSGAMDRWKFGMGDGKTLIPDLSIGAQDAAKVAASNAVSAESAQSATNAMDEALKSKITGAPIATSFNADIPPNQYVSDAPFGKGIMGGSSGASQFNSTMGANPAIATAPVPSMPTTGTAIEAPKSFRTGMALIDENPGWSLLGAGALGGIGGYMLSSGSEEDSNNNRQAAIQEEQYTFPSMSPNYQPTINIPRSRVKQYYADGGITGINQPVDIAPAPEILEAPPVNKFYADALAAAQQATGEVNSELEAPVVEPAPVQLAAAGGIMGDSNLGGYAHGGIPRLTRGPGDGVSDSIPAEIGDTGKQPARLADGEFVIPARIVSELGNGSTEAGARALQAMVDKIQHRRKKSIGKGKVAVDSKARKGLLA